MRKYYLLDTKPSLCFNKFTMMISNALRDKRIQVGNHSNAGRRGEIRVYRLRAAIALGKPLPENASVHHHDEDHLVICQDEPYHRFIHAREHAYQATGDPHKRKCTICHEYDNVANMTLCRANSGFRHPKCHADAEYLRSQKRPQRRKRPRRKYGL